MAPRTMSAEDFVVDQEGPVSYAAQATRASGHARSSAGAAPYPLYGIGQTPASTVEVVPFYRTQWFAAALGATAVAGVWAYFGWWKPRSERKKRSERNRKARKNLKAGNED